MLGSNKHGNLGIGIEEQSLTPVIIESLLEAASFGIKVSEMKVGERHTLAVMNMSETGPDIKDNSEGSETKSRIFVWGNNSFSQLGVKGVKKKVIDIPHLLVPEDFTPEVLFVDAHSTYSGAVDVHGNVIIIF